MEQDTVPSPRIKLNLDVTFKKNYGRNDCVGKIKNISLSGAFLEMSGLPVDINEKLNLNIEVASRKRKLTAYVVWKNQYGCGIRFEHHSNRDLQIIDDLIYFAESAKSELKFIAENIFKKVS